jgi:hypothetical protein
MGFGRGEKGTSAMQRGSKENFILLVLFLAAVLLVVAAAIAIGYFFATRGDPISNGPSAIAVEIGSPHVQTFARA